jgi:cytochrome P450
MMLKPLRDAPAPPGRSPAGHLRAYARDPLGFLTSAARLGPIVRLRFATTRAVLVSDPDLIEEVLATRARDYVKARAVRAHRYLLGNGLLTNEGESWLRQRRLAQPAFRRDRIAAYATSMVDGAVRLLDGCGSGEVHDAHELMKRLTSDIAARTLFGSAVDADSPDLPAALDAVMRRYESRRGLSRLLPLSVPIPSHLRYRRALHTLDRLALSFIRARREAGQPGDDLLSMLLQARDEEGVGMTDRQLRDELVTLFVGGYDTPALGLTWLIHLLARHPNAAGALTAEVDRVLEGRLPKVDDVPRLRLVDAAVREALRLYPPAWILGRDAVRDTTIGEYAVPAGTLVLVSPWVMHRDPRFFERPGSFEPERWLDDLESRLPRCVYFPFGAGPRVCIGASFAMMEAVLVAAVLVQRFSLRPAEGAVELWPTLTLRPRDTVPVVLNARQRSAPAFQPVDAFA